MGIKVLWICNFALPMAAEYLGMESSNKEGWLTGLCDTILRQAERTIDLAIAFPAAPGREEAGREAAGQETSGQEAGGGCMKWQVPVQTGGSLTCYGFAEDTAHPERYPDGLEDRLRGILEDCRPQVVHCFGTEYPHTLAASRVCPGERLLIGIQGLCEIYAQDYLSDLPERVVRRVTLRDFLRRDDIPRQQEKFRVRGAREREALRGAGHITGRTWIDRQYAKECAPDARYHFMNETLRRNFYEGDWREDTCEAHRIFLSQGDYPIKGLHYMLHAMPAIMQKYPDARLYVAGNCIVGGKGIKGRLKISSYGKYLLELIRKYGLQTKVFFLGRLPAEEMKAQYLRSGLFVCPSSIENSPNSLGEAMLLGMPCVAADVGGIRSIFTDGEDGILYPGFGDPVYADAADKEAAQASRLAGAVLELWSDRERMLRYAQSARAHARATHDGAQNYRRLTEIYRSIADG